MSLCQCPEMRPSPAILRVRISRLRAENDDSDADPREVGVIDYSRILTHIPMKRHLRKPSAAEVPI